MYQDIQIMVVRLGSKRTEQQPSASWFFHLFLQTLDFETKSSYTLHVEASNRYVDTRFLSAGPYSDTALVCVLVQNVDEPPIFSSPVSRMVVSEAAAVGTDVGSVSAYDPDTTNSPVRYDGSEFYSDIESVSVVESN